ncbi:YbaB/EbfC family nucleoid-associated protein [Amycolatopsis viridis]|uniref:DNA-binding protein YbaB n=1 Tax=Amycolatopsis viridis TaxID=185678 RepID=A0ABX0T0E0_9PSEU|nr:YbaB/EbfC family nucleoid-associated protein [Amycolatopsis viridis]NIH82696.1 DNA-binding protein YbaB [Amycolatopsis viridis]
MSPEFDRLVAQFEQFRSRLRQADERFAAVGRMSQELAGLEVVATSPDRAVTVVAGPSGAIKDIRLTEQAMRRPAQALSTALMATLRQAVAEAARRQAGIVESAVGGEMNLTDQVLETQAQLFGTTVEELRATIGQGTPAPASPAPQAEAAPADPAPARRPGQEEGEDLSQEDFFDDKPSPAPPPPPEDHQDDDFLGLDEEDR